MKYDCIVIGAGICGLSAARRLAEYGKKVLVVEQSNQIGGLCREGHWKGTRFSIFGPHIFHTDDEEVWQFLSKFTDWTPFNSLYYVKSFCKGKLWSIPINYDELGDHAEYNELLLKEYLYVDYNKKMWGNDVDKVANNALTRLNYSSPLDKRYFKDKYQTFPKNGYNEMFLKMTEIKTMQIVLNTTFDPDDYEKGIPIIYTGRIDRLLGRSDLPFMTMGFQIVLNGAFPWSDKYGVINFPQDFDWIRAHSSKILYQQDTKEDVVIYEHPRGSGPECYPLVDNDSIRLWQDIDMEVYKNYPNIIAAGRAGKFEYMNMDKAVRSGLDAADKVLKGNK